MGSHLTRSLLMIRPEGITHPAYLVLLKMAAIALDQDRKDLPARTYFAGWIPLAMALGYEDPPEGESLHPTAHKAVQRAITELLGLKLLSIADDEIQRTHKYRVYALNLGPLG